MTDRNAPNASDAAPAANAAGAEPPDALDPGNVPGTQEFRLADDTAFWDPREEIVQGHPDYRATAWRVALLRERALPLLMDRTAALPPSATCVFDPLPRWEAGTAAESCLSCGTLLGDASFRCLPCCFAYRVVCAEADRALKHPAVVATVEVEGLDLDAFA